MSTSFTAEVMKLKRLSNSESGNPRWRVITDKGIFLTETDSQAGYSLASAEYQSGRVKIVIGRNNKITHITKLGE